MRPGSAAAGVCHRRWQADIGGDVAKQAPLTAAGAEGNCSKHTRRPGLAKNR